MAYNRATALDLVKANMDRAGVTTPTSISTYWGARVDAAALELEGKGIHLEDTADDNMLVADLATQRARARDKQGGLPEWLSQQIRERWLKERGEST